MCGIAGLIAFEKRSPIGRGDLARMATAMAHRGPDGEGMWISPCGSVGFAHRRLAIIDLDQRASQPMADAGDRLHIVYNGEIYNHRALRRELEAAGARFSTDHSDTEVLLEGYRVWGLDRLLTRLQGMYAFALYDAATDTAMLVRDPLGIKPLYFTEHGARLAFASEIKALLTLPGLVRRVDRSALYHYLSFMTAPAPATMFAGIAKLPAGHVLEIGPDRNPRPRRFWQPSRFIQPNSASRVSFDDAAGQVRSLLEAAVEKHMVADVPVGVFLSGGVDSSTLLALMRKYSSGPVRSFTVGFADDGAMNETEEARDAARHFGAEHHEVLIDACDMERSLEAIVRHQDEPLADWVCVPLWHVARLANAASTKAILVGEGADELFLGYPAYKRFLDLDARARRLARFVPPGAAGLLASAARLLPPERLGLRGLIDHVHRSLARRETFWTGAVAYWETQKCSILTADATPAADGWSAYGLRGADLDQRDSHAVIADIYAGVDAACPHAAQHSRMVAAELALRLPELLLMRVDKMTMAHSLESRVPFLDRPLVEHVLGLAQDTLMPQGRLKALLKTAVQGLVPDAVLARPKRGFAAPVAHWLKGPAGHRLEAEVLRSPVLDAAGLDRTRIARLFAAHRIPGKDLALWLWPLINLAIWYRIWIEEGPA